LSDTDQMVADPTDDIRGRTVRDRDGDEIGTVEDLLVDEQEGKVRFLRVEHGGVLGFGATPSFVPVEAVVRVSDDVHVDRAKSEVAEAPRYAPDLVDRPDDETAYYGSLYGYYGYVPFWGPAALPPPRP